MRISHDSIKNKLVTLTTLTFITLLITSCGGGGSSDVSTTDGGTGATTSGAADVGAADAGVGDTAGGTDAGIGGTTSGGGGSALGAMVGIVDITRVTNFTSVRAYFHQYSDGLALTLDDALSAIEQPVGTCRVSKFMTSDIPNLEIPEEFFDHESRDAGEIITITSTEGTWVSLARGGDSEFITYQAEVADGASLTPVPSGLTIDIPGADYPAFANVAVGDVTELSGISLENNAQLTWDAGTADNEIELTVGTVTPSFQVDYTYCRLTDNGSFELPASVQASIAAADEFDYALTRLATTVVRKDNAAFAVISRSKRVN